MIHFEISKEVEKDEKDILLSCRKEKILSRHEA